MHEDLELGNSHDLTPTEESAEKFEEVMAELALFDREQQVQMKEELERLIKAGDEA